MHRKQCSIAPVAISAHQELTARRRVIDLSLLTVITRMFATPLKIVCKRTGTLAEIMKHTDELRHRGESESCRIHRHQIADTQEMRTDRLLRRFIAPYMC